MILRRCSGRFRCTGVSPQLTAQALGPGHAQAAVPYQLMPLMFKSSGHGSSYAGYLGLTLNLGSSWDFGAKKNPKH